jgi:tetratricopeptide (TPR) repeat protein
VLQELNYDAEAIRIFKRILRKGLHDIVSYSYYKDKRKRALSLINDCRLKIGVGYFALRRGRLAAKWLNLYLRNVDKGIPSLHNKREAVDRLETLENIRLVEKYHDKGQWEQAKSIAKNELRKYPNDVWLLAILSSAYHEQHTYKKAFQIIRKAIKIAPNEPLVMWHYAGTLDTLGNHKKAMHVYKKIIRKGIKRIAFKDTTEGIRWAKSLINDCRYRIALCYLDIGKKPLAIKYMRQHLANRSAIAPSIYPIKKVRRKLKEIMVA